MIPARPAAGPDRNLARVTATPESIAVVDIDGVVADVRHRLPYLNRPRPRWDLFFAAAPEDPLLSVGADVVADLAAMHPIVWLSGRPEHLRPATTSWLARHQLPAGRLELRQDGDRRPGAVMKLERLRQLASTFGIAAVVDDDPQVVDALHAAGLPVVLADWVPHERTLRRAQQHEGRT